ncbi:hypothetical protein [Methylorubrum zatmanii]|uniref:Uncharacterized protein n=1 Tax=Methylorubrum zatmanii TaxID=29429 RepID=A0ABW1WSR6_9HYPH|nr:hypothetical protein [Methylorubrum zatmanii]MBD8909515.1 hypothetical protein [Methylorubrum zatmanii]
MTILARFGGRIASAVVRVARRAPTLIAVASVIGLSAGQAASPDLDGDRDETARSVAYRHYV